MPNRFPTPYPEVNALLDVLRSGVTAILGDQLVGMYLYGSLALDAFNASSDVDFLVVTTSDLDAATVAALAALHQQIAASGLPWATELEGSYIPQAALRRYDPPHTLHPHLDRGAGERLVVAQHDTDWVIQRYVLREHGITLVGPAPSTLIEPVSPADLRRAIVTFMREWWALMLDQPAPLLRPGYAGYAVLTMCRVLYTLERGDVVSKPVAARWALTALADDWRALIERVLAGSVNRDDVGAVQDFIRYTLCRSQSQAADGSN
ncbi:MAG: DUF4111 domain-containing protein [Chloroflexi bacterium]|nr:DUF4111 domain-containing protein [Chloroflexota bacterium]